MCGIAGKIDFAGAVDPELIQRMCAVMTHRGPESRGTYFEPGVGLGMQRLAIIDIAGGDQPIFNEDGTIAVVMNGEIYNYLELREELLRRGHHFASRTDTEVLVHLYEEHGDRLAEHLRGMFAFAIWDSRRRQLLLGRDRVGKKPLFWARAGSKVWFASEIRALLEDPELDRSIDPDAISAYLALQYVPHPLSVFRGIRKLSPASTVWVTADREQEQTYWALDYTQKLADVAHAELEERLREQILEATRIRLMSEVPLGAFLSGGVDSSAVVWAMAQQMTEPVKTFSIGFSEADHDELAFARMVAKRFATDHHEFVVEPHALEIMPKLARHYGEPFADSSAIPSFYLAELTRRHVTVALNGDGGDEGLAGYRRYATDSRVRQLDLDAATAAAPRVALAVRPRRADRERHALAREPARSASDDGTRGQVLAPDVRVRCNSAASPPDAGLCRDDRRRASGCLHRRRVAYLGGSRRGRCASRRRHTHVPAGRPPCEDGYRNDGVLSGSSVTVPRSSSAGIRRVTAGRTKAAQG